MEVEENEERKQKRKKRKKKEKKKHRVLHVFTCTITKQKHRVNKLLCLKYFLKKGFVPNKHVPLYVLKHLEYFLVLVY